MKLLNGKELGEEVLSHLAVRLSALHKKGVTPALVTILVGDDAPSKIYVTRKLEACAKLGIQGILEERASFISQTELMTLIRSYNERSDVHGILIQKPFPPHIDELAILSTISPEKDVDGFHPENVGLLAIGAPRFTPCTPLGCMYMLQSVLSDLRGVRVVVVGRSNLVGKPLSLLLINAGATVTVCNSHTKNLQEVTTAADVIIVATGEPKLITQDHVKENAIVIDVGIHRDSEGKLSGDVDFDVVSKIAGALSPVPGGVGKMTIAMLMQNTVLAAEMSLARKI